jgi:hypothetical protein
MERYLHCGIVSLTFHGRPLGSAKGSGLRSRRSSNQVADSPRTLRLSQFAHLIALPLRALQPGLRTKLGIFSSAAADGLLWIAGKVCANTGR